MNIAFLGTPEFAVVPLDALFRAGHTIGCVVAQPDRAAGRGQALREPATKRWAGEHGIPLLQPEKVRDGRLAAELRRYQPDVLVVVAYGRILGEDLLSLAPFGALNAHASLLPRWRGAAPMQWALAHGDAETGVTVMRMEAGLDTGPVLLQRVLAIDPEEILGTLHDRLSALAAEALTEALPLLEARRLVPVAQDSSDMTLAPVLTREDGRLRFELPADELARRVRAFTPWPGAFTTLAGQLLKVHLARPATASGTVRAPELGDARPPPPGTVRAEGDRLVVTCGSGELVLVEVQLEGRRRVSAADFVKGHPIPGGTVLGT